MAGSLGLIVFLFCRKSRDFQPHHHARPREYYGLSRLLWLVPWIFLKSSSNALLSSLSPHSCSFYKKSHDLQGTNPPRQHGYSYSSLLRWRDLLNNQNYRSDASYPRLSLHLCSFCSISPSSQDLDQPRLYGYCCLSPRQQLAAMIR